MSPATNRPAPIESEVAIVGGGMAGLCLAIALDKLGLSCVLLEREASRPGQLPSSFDARAIALSATSLNILEQLGLHTGQAPHHQASSQGPGQSLKPWLSPIRQVHVSQQAHLGITHLDTKHPSEHFGAVIEAPRLGQALLQHASQGRHSGLLDGQTLVSLETHADSVTLTTSSHRIRTRLVIGADGAQSSVRKALGINARHIDHGQSAIVANIGLGKDHAGTAYERFTQDGPLAMLPMTTTPDSALLPRSALVMSLSHQHAQQALDSSDQDFLQQLQAAFGWRLGRFSHLGKRHCFPLHSVFASETARPRCLLIGNAAHALHPIAGQGFNLSLRDVWQITHSLGQADNPQRLLDKPRLALDIAQARQADQALIKAFTLGLEQGFSPKQPLLAHLRGASMQMLDGLPSIKQSLARYAMGQSRRQQPLPLIT